MTAQLSFPIPEPDKPRITAGVSLRPYQEEALAAVKKLHYEGENRQLLQMATGGGKTVLFSQLSIDMNCPTLILAHREELLTQAIAKYRAADPEVDIGMVKAEYNNFNHRVVVASVQTLSRENRFNEVYGKGKVRPRLLITDEAHHSRASTYLWLYEKLGLDKPRLPGAALHLGVTATPKRKDGQGLDAVYDHIAYQWGMKDGIIQGYLSDLSGYTLQIQNDDMDDVGMIGGDFDQGALGRVMTKGKKAVARTEAIVECWAEQALLPDGSHRPTIVFCVTVDHADMVSAAFNKAGFRFEVVSGEMKTEERHKIYSDFHAGKIHGIANCAVLTEGYDEPKVSCIVVARPTRSQGLYIQCVGRGTRLYPGKPNCLILDVADISRKMSLNAPVTLASALGLGKQQKKLESVASQLRIPGMTGLGKWAKEANAKGGGKFDPFQDPFAEQSDIDLRWVQGGPGLILSLPKNKYGQHENEAKWLVITPRKDWLFDVVEVSRYQSGENSRGFPIYTQEEIFVNKFGLPDEQTAAIKAQEHAIKLVPNLKAMKGRNAEWKLRAEPATEKQIDMLVKMGVAIPPRVTKATASLLLDAEFAKKVRVKIQRSAKELELI